jgi:hypothetical protein
MKKGLVLGALFSVLLYMLPLRLHAQALVSPRSAWESLFKRPKVFGGLDSHRSFISNRDVSIFGVRAGLEFDGRVRIAIGAYTLLTEFRRQFQVPLPGGSLDTVSANLRYSHLSYVLEYVALTSKRWEISFPLSVGLGEARFPTVPGFQPQQFLQGSVGLNVQYKIFPFLGLAGGVGMRQILAGRPIIEENFNSPTYSFGVKIYTGWFIKQFRAYRDKRRA